MKRKTAGRRVAAKEKIQEAAVELFTQKGYKRTTISAIARRAGVNELTIFRNFGNKKNLLHQVYFQLTPVADHADLSELTGGKDVEKDLAIFFRNYLVLHIRHMPAYRLSLQLQEEIYDRDLYYASFANIQGMIAQFVEYLESLKDKKLLDGETDCRAFAECMFSLFLIEAMELPPAHNERYIAAFVKHHAAELAPFLVGKEGARDGNAADAPSQ